MKYTYFFKAFFFMSVLLNACDASWFSEKGNGEIVDDMRRLEPFEKVSVEDNYEVLFEKANSPSVIITVDENLISYVETSIVKNTLKIRNTEKIKGSEPIQITIFYQEINEIKATGAIVLNNNDVMKSDRLVIDFPGAGMVSLEVELDHLDINLSGAGLLSLSGYTNTQSIQLSGAGNVDASHLISNECDIRLSGFGGAEVLVKEKLNARVDGAGIVKYSGEPNKVKKEVNGLGDIIKDESTTKDSETHSYAL